MQDVRARRNFIVSLWWETKRLSYRLSATERMPNFIPDASPHSHIVHTRQEFKKERSESSINIQIIAECNFEYWQIN